MGSKFRLGRSTLRCSLLMEWSRSHFKYKHNVVLMQLLDATLIACCILECTACYLQACALRSEVHDVPVPRLKPAWQATS